MSNGFDQLGQYTFEGPVGIGKISLAAKLDVDGDIKADSLNISRDVTAGKYFGNGSNLTGIQLEPNSINSAQLANNAVTTDKIADNAVTAAKIPDGAITLRKLDPSISFIPNGGVVTAQLADNAVTTAKIADNSITTPKIVNGAITRDKLDPSISFNIPDGGVGTVQLANNAVTTPKIADNSITTPKIVNGAITRDKLDPSISFNIPNGGVGTVQLANNAVTTPKIADNSITTPKIVNGAITRDKLDPSISLGGGDSLWEVTAGGITNKIGNFVGIKGAITPSVGNVETAGIMFPKDPGGGSGDAAWMRYYPRTGEACTLEIGISNDPDDHIALMPSAGNVGIGTITPQDKLDVAGNLRILTNSNPIKFTSAWSDFSSGASASPKNQAEISNDTGDFKTLMIVGNKSAGGGRRVSVWDRLEVNGDLGIGIQPGALLHVFAPDNRFGNAGGSIKLFPTDGTGADFTYDGGDDGVFTFTNTADTANKQGRTVFQSSQGTLLTLWNSGQVNVDQSLFVQGKQVQGSSRKIKENITDFSTAEAIETLAGLNPVKFNYRTDKEKEPVVGFIAEDVPELVATAERKGICALEIVAVLTKVIQQQQQELSCLKERLNVLEASV
jgi:hypothetical protein